MTLSFLLMHPLKKTSFFIKGICHKELQRIEKLVWKWMLSNTIMDLKK